MDDPRTEHESEEREQKNRRADTGVERTAPHRYWPAQRIAQDDPDERPRTPYRKPMQR